MILERVGSKLGLQIFLLVLCLPVLLPSKANGQTFGPLNPATMGNDTGIGTNAWGNPNRTASTNNMYSTVNTRGLTQYISASDFGFAIPLTSTINGIRVEVERSVPTVTAVALLNGWSTGLTKTITAGTDRCLVVIAATENGDGATDVTSLTYGGQSMTQVGEFSVGTVGGFTNRIEVWILRDAGIVAAGAGTTLVPTISATSFYENTEVYSSAVFQFVDQYNPIFQVRNSTVTGNVVPYQLASALNTFVGSMSIAAVSCGNNSTPAAAIGGTNTYAVNSGFTEGTDIYFANPAFNSGSCLQTSHKASAAISTEQPTFTFAGTANRQVAMALTLQPATGLDNSVRLVKGGAVIGNNYAQGTVPWPTTDAYATYGGATDLWGTTWTPAEINAANFGVRFSAIHQSGTLQVDHIRITVFATAAMPVELVYFRGNVINEEVVLTWKTATEINNDFFTIERSTNGIDFTPIDTIDGAGNSQQPIQYSTTDKNFYTKQIYYRLKQTDFDGQFTYSDVIWVDTEDLVRDLAFFPNPASASVYLINSSEDDVSLRIVSQSGVVVFEKIQDRQFNEVDISEIPQGLYLIELRRGQTRKIEKLVVNR